MEAEQAVRDVLPGHPLARHIDDFLTDLANANKPRNTIRAYRGDLIGFAAHLDGEIGGLTAAPIRAFLGEIVGQAASTRKLAAVASLCRWAVRHELLEASPMDRIGTSRFLRRCPGRRLPPTSRRCWMRSAPGGRARTCRWAYCGTGSCSRANTRMRVSWQSVSECVAFVCRCLLRCHLLCHWLQDLIPANTGSSVLPNSRRGMTMCHDR